jgi:hypothetical protein
MLEERLSLLTEALFNVLHKAEVGLSVAGADQKESGLFQPLTR